jgi:hypothetical protein
MNIDSIAGTVQLTYVALLTEKLLQLISAKQFVSKTLSSTKSILHIFTFDTSV